MKFRNFLIRCSSLLQKAFGLLVPFALMTGLAGNATSADLSPADLLQILKSRDAQVDNVNLKYATFGEFKQDPFPAWKFPELAKKNGWENEKPSIMKFKFLEQMIIRGPDTTFIREVAPEFRSLQNGAYLMPATKWSNRHGKVRELTDDGSQDRFSQVLEINDLDVPVGVVDEQRNEIEFAFGVWLRKTD